MKTQTKFKETKIGMFPEDWEVKELKEVASYVAEKININELNLKTFISTENLLPDKKGVVYASSLPQTGKANRFKIDDILFSNIRTYFKKLWLAKFNGGCSNDVLIIRPNNSSLNNKFLYYSLSQEKFFEFTVLTSKGTKMPRGDKDAIMSYQINIPTLTEQSAIAKILSDLDLKIELSQQMNKTLEAIGQAIFKRWFIDFEFPNEKGKPYKSSGGEFVESDLGLIPRDWKISNLDNGISIKGGSTPDTKNPAYWNGEINWCTPKDLSRLNFPVLLKTDRKISKLGLGTISSGLLPKGVLLLSSRAPIGYLAISEIEVSINQGFIGIICDKELSNAFMLNWLFYNMEIVKSMANGSTFQEINKSNFRKIKITVPNKTILEKFDFIAMPIFDKTAINEKESSYLAKIRDSLLPKLMSGEVRVR